MPELTGRVKQALPRVAQPYELVKTVLAALGSGPYSSDELGAELESVSAATGASLRLDDVDPWLRQALGLTLKRGDSISLTREGAWLAEVVGGGSFDCRFLQHLLSRGNSHFRYFNDAHAMLERRRRRGEVTISSKELSTQLNLVVANKTSGPVIRRLLVGLGALVKTDDGYQIENVCHDSREMAPELQSLLVRSEQLIESDSFSYDELRERLVSLVGDETLQKHEAELRQHLQIVSTRSVAWVVGVTWKEVDG